MGNEVGALDRTDQQFKKEIGFLKKRSSESILEEEHAEKSFEVQSDNKWRQDLLRSLKQKAIAKGKEEDEMCIDLQEIIINIKQDFFLKAINNINAMISMKTLEIDSKKMLKQSFSFQVKQSHHQSESVNIEIDTRFRKGSVGDDSISTGSTQSSPDKSFHKRHKQKRDLQAILVKQINQEYHPLRSLKDSFIMMLKMKYRMRLDERVPNKKEERDKILESIHDDINFYCCFVSEGCGIYRKWIIRETGIREARYPDFAKRLILESLFTGVNLAEELFPLIKQICIKDLQGISAKLPSHIQVTKFDIKPELAIQGAFMNSLILLSDFDRIQSPKKCMNNLSLLKNQICYDIDQYHKIFKTEKNFKIDGQNLLSIVCFLICRMKPKLQQIYTQLNLLNVVFGEDASTFFSDASYLLTTMLAAFEYLTSQKFLQDL